MATATHVCICKEFMCDDCKRKLDSPAAALPPSLLAALRRGKFVWREVSIRGLADAADREPILNVLMNIIQPLNHAAEILGIGHSASDDPRLDWHQRSGRYDKEGKTP